MIADDCNIAVIGGGSFATALIKILTENCERVGWWMRNEEAIAHILEHDHNPNYLSNVDLEVDRIDLTSDINRIVRDYQTLVFAVPSAFLKETLAKIDVPLRNKFMVSAIKGIVPDENLIVGEYFHQILEVPYESIAIISGPCHAEEVAMEKLSYLTVSSLAPALRQTLNKQLSTSYIKVVESDDILGTEYAAVIKNIVAIASGICHALGYGDNFQAVLVSNALLEMKRFMKSVYPIKREITGSAYLGDLLVTAYSSFSRNRQFGHMIGKGYSVSSVKLEMNMVAEGYYAVDCIQKMNKFHDVKMPICNTVYKILYKGKSPAKKMKHLAKKLS